MRRTEIPHRRHHSRFSVRRLRTRTPLDRSTAAALRAELDAIADHRAWDGRA